MRVTAQSQVDRAPSAGGREAIFAQVSAIIRREAKIDEELAEQTDLLSDLKLDSIVQLSLVVALENHFEVCFEPADEAAITTVGSVVDLVARRLRESDARAAEGAA